MYSEVAWVLVFLRIQIHLQIIPNPDYLPDYLSVSYEYAKSNETIEGSKKMIWYFHFFWNLNWKEIVTTMGKKVLYKSKNHK